MNRIMGMCAGSAGKAQRVDGTVSTAKQAWNFAQYSRFCQVDGKKHAIFDKIRPDATESTGKVVEDDWIKALTISSSMSVCLMSGYFAIFRKASRSSGCSKGLKGAGVAIVLDYKL